jgi:hypothetical protein
MAEVVQPARGIAEVLAEVRKIREVRDEHVRAGTLNLFDEDACERYLREVIHTNHQTFARSYPVLARDIVHNQTFAMRAVKKYFKWLSNTQDPRKDESENLFYRQQAEYMFFASMQQTIGKMKARACADKCYDALVADDAKMHEFVDAAVDQMRDRDSSARGLVIERLQKRARLMALALSGAERPDEPPADESVEPSLAPAEPPADEPAAPPAEDPAEAPAAAAPAPAAAEPVE